MIYYCQNNNSNVNSVHLYSRLSYKEYNIDGDFELQFDPHNFTINMQIDTNKLFANDLVFSLDKDGLNAKTIKSSIAFSALKHQYNIDEINILMEYWPKISLVLNKIYKEYKGIIPVLLKESNSLAIKSIISVKLNTNDKKMSFSINNIESEQSVLSFLENYTHKHTISTQGNPIESQKTDTSNITHNKNKLVYYSETHLQAIIDNKTKKQTQHMTTSIKNQLLNNDLFKKSIKSIINDIDAISPYYTLGIINVITFVLKQLFYSICMQLTAVKYADNQEITYNFYIDTTKDIIFGLQVCTPKNTIKFANVQISNSDLKASYLNDCALIISTKEIPKKD